MKKLIVTTVILLFAVIAGQAQEKKKGLYSVAFYNLENLFDTMPVRMIMSIFPMHRNDGIQRNMCQS